MKKLISAVIFGSMLSTSAMAWPGADRPANEDPSPVNTPGATGRTQGDSLSVSETIRSQSSSAMECDILGSARAYRNGDRQDDQVDVFKAVNRLLIDPGMKTTVTFKFKSRYFGEGFKARKQSLRAEAACKDLTEPGQSPGQGPAPHDMCDPEFEKCGWTCQSNTQNPDQCADQDQGWADDVDGDFL